LKTNQIFTPQIKAQLVSAIEQAELSSSGEIRLHIDNYCKSDVLDRAVTVFETLEMHKTDLRNGVLFYLAVCDKKFAVIGDVGINQKVPPNFWDEIKSNVLINFKQNKFAEGLSEGIIKAGEQLKTHFPYQKEDKNELDNEISIGND
jgi:uncharacterized membrane protein